MKENDKLKYETISNILQSRENSTLTFISIVTSAAFAILTFIASENNLSKIPPWLFWMGFLITVFSLVYRLITSNFDIKCYQHLRDNLEENTGAYKWLKDERDKSYLFKYRGMFIDGLLAMLISSWITLPLRLSELLWGVISFIVFLAIWLLECIAEDP